jgi:Flp pilus assembly protein TadD
MVHRRDAENAEKKIPLLQNWRRKMPRRHTALLALACSGLMLLASPVWGQRGPTLMQLRQAVQNNPQDPEANYKLGMKYKELGRPQVAIKYLKQAVRLKADYKEALEALVKLQGGESNYSGAASDLQKLMKLQPKSKELRDRASIEQNKQGVALLQEGNFKEAEAAFREAAKNNPKASTPFNNLGVAYMQAGRTKEAAGAFQEAVRRNPDNAQAHFNLGLMCVAKGNMRAAFAESLNLRRLNPDLAHQLDILSSPPRTPYPYPPVK